MDMTTQPAPPNPEQISSGSACNWEQFQSMRASALDRRPSPSLPEQAPAVEPIILAWSLPDPNTLPIDDLISASERVLRRSGVAALQYGGALGYPGLRDWLAHDVNRREGLSVTSDNFALTCGSSGALEFLCEALLDPGDVVYVERPTYPGGLRTIVSCLAEVVGVGMDDDGMDPDELQRAIGRSKSEGKRPKVLYTMSNFHNPQGTTLTLERRKSVLEMCRREDVLIAQDDAYGVLGFGDGVLPSFYALAEGVGAVLLGTFSKTLATGLRLGWIMGDKEIVGSVASTRLDLGVSPWTSRLVADFCESGSYDAHIPRVVDVYRHKRDTMLTSLSERCTGFARWTVPEGAFFLWLQLNDKVNPDRLHDAAWQEGVGYLRGRLFFDDGSGADFARLCYSHASEAEIPEAIMRFGRAMEQASTP